MEINLYETIMASLIFGIGATVGIGIRGTLERDINRIEQTVDLNKDGLADKILYKEGGKKEPLYAIMQEENPVYVSGKEYQKRNPEGVIDYSKIERKLNE